LDASRSVPVTGSLLGENKEEFFAEIRAEYEKLRTDHLNRNKEKKYISIQAARENKHKSIWSGYTIAPPDFLGNKLFYDYPLEEIAQYIDWTPFFQTWEMKGRYPKLLDDPQIGHEARKLFDDAQKLLKEVIENKSLEARAVIGFYPANTVDDDTIVVFKDEKRTKELTRFHTLRQQGQKASNLPNLSFADFIAPLDTGVSDYIGGFAVTAGIGIENLIEKYQKDHDDYNIIMIKAIADRLAEAFTELLHKKVRQEFWGYASDESLENEELIQEKYQGIRPAPGYPGCPDHTEKITLFQLLRPEESGITLTENLAMYPASSVSGFYYSHPDSKYFGLGKILQDQVQDIAERKNMAVKELERWLSPNLNYDADTSEVEVVQVKS
jgi:5-methyltetrahydrofolate--homocysteine methyltransferase